MISQTKYKGVGDCIAQRWHTCSHPATPGSILSVPKKLSLDVAEKFYEGTAWSSRQRLDNFNRTHLALDSGKLVLQKKVSNRSSEYG